MSTKYTTNGEIPSNIRNLRKKGHNKLQIFRLCFKILQFLPVKMKTEVFRMNPVVGVDMYNEDEYIIGSVENPNIKRDMKTGVKS